MQGELDVRAVAFVLELFQLRRVGSDQAAHHAFVALHALHLGLGCIEVAACRGNIGFNSADIGLDVGNVAGYVANLFLRRLPRLREFYCFGVLLFLLGEDGPGACVDLLLRGADVLGKGIGGGAKSCIGSVKAVGEISGSSCRRRR